MRPLRWCCVVLCGSVWSDVGSVVELSAAVGSVWVGVDLDEPVGKHAGTVLGRSYFTARGNKHGTFVKPAAVQCGDFPEIDPFDEDGQENEAEHVHSTTQQQQPGEIERTQSSSQPSQTVQADRSALYEEL